MDLMNFGLASCDAPAAEDVLTMMAGSLGIFVTNVSDLDDLLPVLCAYQIEWNKMHQRLSRSELGAELAAAESRHRKLAILYVKS